MTDTLLMVFLTSRRAVGTAILSLLMAGASQANTPTPPASTPAFSIGALGAGPAPDAGVAGQAACASATARVNTATAIRLIAKSLRVGP